MTATAVALAAVRWNRMTRILRQSASLPTRLRFSLARWLLGAGALKAGGFSVVPAWVTESFLKPTFHALTRDGYQRNSVVFACVSAHAFAFPEPPLLVYDGEGDRGSALPRHPLRKLLRMPNPIMGEAELMLTTAAWLAIGGNAYWHKVRGRAGQVVELWPYHAGSMRPVPGGPTWVERYEFTVDGGTWTPVPAEDVVHFKWPAPDPAQPWQAQPPLQAAAADVDTDNEITRYLFALLKNDAIPRTIVTVPSDRFMTDDEVRRTKDQFRERYGGDRRGDVAIVEGGAAVTRLGLNLEELAFDALHRIPETRITAAFRVPAILAGVGAGLERATYANYQEARRAFTQDTLVPLWRIVGSEISADLLPEFGGAVECRFATGRVAALQENEDARWKRVLMARRERVLTQAETRRALGYAEQPAAGDEDPAPALPTPAQGDGAQTPPAQPILGYHIEAGVADIAEARTQLGLPDGETEAARLKRLSTALAVAQAAVSFGVSPQDALALVGLDLAVAAPPPSGAGTVAEQARGPGPAQAKAWGLPDREADVAADVAAYLAGQYRRAADQIDQVYQAKADGDDLAAQLGLDLGEQIRQVMARYYVLAVGRAYGDAMASLDLDRAFDLENPRVQETLGELATRVARVAETTREEVRALVGQAAAEGWSPGRLATQLAGLAEVHSRERAETIAVTELADAYTRGSLLAYRDSGVVARVRWLTTEGACAICGPLANVAVPLGDLFPGNLAGPTAHPRCRCALAPEVS
jgi:HK97 family phage portal protein